MTAATVDSKAPVAARKDKGQLTGGNWFVSSLLSLLAWMVAGLFAFPLVWMVVLSLKTNQAAEGSPDIFFSPTLDRFRELTGDGSEFGDAFWQSFFTVIPSTIFVMILAVPAAYALSIRAVPKWRDVLFFFISTKFLPIVAAAVPIFFITSWLDYLNSRIALVVLYTAMNLPLAVWMLRSFFHEVPKELIEAAQIDGASLRSQLTSVILPIVAPGLAATALLCVIFAWNEYFLALVTNSREGTIPIWVAGQQQSGTGEASMASVAAASTLACLPVLLAGWVAQKRMIRGLAMGAIK
jgi:sorbitol/mannitol transport system permease protein